MDKAMRITQLTTGLPFFKAQMMEKYRLHEYTDKQKPLLLFGLYNDEELIIAKHHKAHLTIVWCGGDSMTYLPQKSEIIKALTNVRHIALSEFVSADLHKFGIEHIVLPITPTAAIKNRKPRGENIYAYVDVARSEKYGYHLLPEIQERTNKRIIIADHTTYSREQLNEVYESCFIGLRLTKHDGLPNTVIEMGLMGRNCIYNGKLPNAIPYTDVDSIVASIRREYNQRHQINQAIVDATFDYLNIGDDWLNVN